MDEGNNVISTRQLTGSTLQPGESAYFELPKGSLSIVYMPGGTVKNATKIWIRNNGTGTWHGYPMTDEE